MVLGRRRVNRDVMPMTEPKTKCTTCGGQILPRTAERNGGRCAVCLRDANIKRGVEKEYVEKDGRKYKIVPPDPVELDVDVDVASLESSGSVKWKNVEDALFLIASEYVRTFSTFHRDKTFYGFAFDCNADYGQIFLCANTRASLSEEARRCKSQSPQLYSHFRIEDLEEELRWALGDWEFQAFTTDGFSDAWKPIEEVLVDVIPWDDDDDHRIEDFRTHFMDMACRCMMRLESEGILNALSRTDDFKTFVADHDESEEHSWSRFEGIRSREGGT
jgi:hypothetical protein